MFTRLWLLVILLSGMFTAQAEPLIRIGETWRYLAGLHPGSASNAWKTLGFNDSGWAAGRSGFSVGFAFNEATVLPATTSYNVAYFRKKFVITDLTEIRWLMFRADFDDGFVAYLNGVEVARANVTATNVPPRDRFVAAEFDLTPYVPLLVVGENILAVEVHGTLPENDDLALVPELLANFQRGPFVQNVATNHAQIIWKTPKAGDTRVDYGTTLALGQTVHLAETSIIHEPRLTGLEPDTRYYYRISTTAGGVTATGHVESFRTMKLSGSVSFAVFGDSGLGSVGQYQVAETLKESGVDLVLHTGDVIYYEFTAGRADPKCLSVYQPHMRSVPYYFSIGNHDIYHNINHYLDAFYLPTNSIPLAQHQTNSTTPEHFYSFDHGDVHFVALYVPYLSQYNIQSGDLQYRWLAEDLAASDKPWKMLFLHHPLMTSAAHRFDDYNFNGIQDRNEVLGILSPLLQQHGVQLVFSGHDHVYEKFAPTNGTHAVVTGGGGVILYGMAELDAASAQFWPAHHHMRVKVEGDLLTMEAVSNLGNVFDTTTIRRAPVSPQVHASTWHTPVIESGIGDNGDGNFNGQRFDFAGQGVSGVHGQSVNPGMLYVNNDRTNLYVGIAQTMFRANNNLFLFVDSPRLSGVTNLIGLGNGVIDPQGQGVDGLDMLENLSFTNFRPAIAVLLGDENGDAQMRSFQRPQLELPVGQGVFRLDATFSDVPGVKVQQYHRSPQTGVLAGEENAGYVEIAIPLAALGGLRADDIIQLGLVAAGGGYEATQQVRELDTAYLGERFVVVANSSYGQWTLQGVKVRLATDPFADVDGDGLIYEDELAHGTNPNLADTDGDGLPDGWEVHQGLNPLSSVGQDGKDGDADEDGFSNLHEYLAGTDPGDPESALKVTVLPMGNGQYRLYWRAIIGRRYVLEQAGASLTNFFPVETGSFPRTATSVNEAYEMHLPEPGVELKIFRVRVLPLE